MASLPAYSGESVGSTCHEWWINRYDSGETQRPRTLNLSHRIQPTVARLVALHVNNILHHTLARMSDPISSSSPLLTHGCPPDLRSILPKSPELDTDELHQWQIFRDARSIRKPTPTRKAKTARRMSWPQRQLSNTLWILKG